MDGTANTQAEERPSEILTYECPSCGATMSWAPDKSCLYCEHCGSRKAVIAGIADEMAFERLARDESGWSGETHVYRCESCGAMEVLEKGEIASSCSFCGAPCVLDDKELPGVRPNAIIPFSVAIESACEAAKKWAKKRIFAPSSFKKSLSPKRVRGVYAPSFTFDTNTFTEYRGTLGEYYYITERMPNGKTRTVRRTRYIPIHGTYRQFFDDIVVQASDERVASDVEKLMPYDTRTSKEYSGGFLSGFSARHYKRDGMECWGIAKSYIRSAVRTAILSRYRYDFVQHFDADTSCSDITYKYLLLPVWVGRFAFRQKNYNFFVNGSTGKVSGKTPLSPWRVGAAVLAGLGAIAGIVLLIMNCLS